MKKSANIFLCFILALTLIMCCSCSNNENTDGNIPNESTSDITGESSSDELSEIASVIGTGDTKIFLDVVLPESTTRFEINTDAEKLSDALTQSGLVKGEIGDYGLFITEVNSVRAVYELDNAYWSISVNSKVASTGADYIEISQGDVISLVYTLA